MNTIPSPYPSNTSVYSVSQLNRETRLLLSEHFLSIQVEGEISNMSTPASGHIYFSLKDANAQIRCAMFRSHRRRVNFAPENGLQVMVTAQVGLYEARGDYQLIVENMQEAGDGALRRAFERLKTNLAKEGLFAPEHKQSLPTLAHTVGIITSPTGAAIKDILAVIRRRFPALPIIIYPVTVQGDAAKYEIAAAIQTANATNQCDALILARGGGSLEDLWAFNEEIVARAIFNSSIPIISGIGHETDVSIADFVADLRAATPSAAAEHITPDQQEWLRLLQHYETRLSQFIQTHLQQQHKTLDWVNKRLQRQHPGKQYQIQFQHLDALELRLQRSLKNRLQQQYINLQTLSAKLAQHHPANKIKTFSQQQKHLTQRLISTQHRLLEQKQQQLGKQSQTLHAVSPLATLNRGYAIVTQSKQEQVINSTESLKKGDLITTRLAHGRIISQIEKLEHDA